jgi:hypothetical protein
MKRKTTTKPNEKVKVRLRTSIICKTHTKEKKLPNKENKTKNEKK